MCQIHIYWINVNYISLNFFDYFSIIDIIFGLYRRILKFLRRAAEKRWRLILLYRLYRSTSYTRQLFPTRTRISRCEFLSLGAYTRSGDTVVLHRVFLMNIYCSRGPDCTLSSVSTRIFIPRQPFDHHTWWPPRFCFLLRAKRGGSTTRRWTGQQSCGGGGGGGKGVVELQNNRRRRPA